MTAPRPYRAGLGLPEAVIIRSHQPGPSTTPLFPRSAGSPPEIDDDRWPPRSFKPAHWDSLDEWKQWNINPTAHGPQHTQGPPVFVPTHGTYDELGRSQLDGYDVTVEAGKNRNLLRREENVEDGPAVADWYRSLTQSAASTRLNTPTASAPRTVVVPARNTVAEPEQRNLAKESLDRSPAPTLSKQKAETVGVVRPSRAVQSGRSDWFIRRALASQARMSSHRDGEIGDATTTTTTTTTTMASTSISHLLSDTPSTRPKPQQYRYVLGPENKGYALLKDRLGWHGGGLGKPVVSRSASSAGDAVPTGSKAVSGEGEDAALFARPSPAARPQRGSEARPVELDDHGNAVVDLTGDTDSSADDDDDDDDDHRGALMSDAEVDNEALQGPGRTAPIATTLKLDRLGLGHRRAAARDHLPSTQKKVTHTAREIREAQKRARYTPQTNGAANLGKKGKKRWKEWDRQDRKRRQAIADSLK